MVQMENQTLADFAHEYYRPKSEMENWMYENQFDFYIELHFLINPISIG